MEPAKKKKREGEKRTIRNREYMSERFVEWFK